MDDHGRPQRRFKRALQGLAALNFDAPRAFFHGGASSAEKYITFTHRMYPSTACRG
jgi:hypothetical protein